MGTQFCSSHQFLLLVFRFSLEIYILIRFDADRYGQNVSVVSVRRHNGLLFIMKCMNYIYSSQKMRT